MDITKLTDIRNDEILLLEFDTEKYDLDTCNSIAQHFNKLFPHNLIVALPKGILINITTIDNPILNNNDEFPFI